MQPLKNSSEEYLFQCDDGSSLLDRTLKDLLVIEDTVEEIYGKYNFYDGVGSNIIRLFNVKKDGPVNSSGTKTFAEVLGKINKLVEDIVPLKPIANPRVEEEHYGSCGR